VYLEQSGVDYEAFEPGEVYEHRPGHAFTAERLLARALRSFHQSPALVELEAARAGDGRLRVAEADLVGVATALSTKTFGKVAANLGWTSVSFPHTLHEGDTIHAVSTVLGTRDSASRPKQGILHVRTEAHSADGRLACRFERRLLVYKRGAGPHAAAGY
jgi:itaconyl-CoA hydratase